MLLQLPSQLISSSLQKREHAFFHSLATPAPNAKPSVHECGYEDDDEQCEARGTAYDECTSRPQEKWQIITGKRGGKRQCREGKSRRRVRQPLQIVAMW